MSSGTRPPFCPSAIASSWSAKSPRSSVLQSSVASWPSNPSAPKAGPSSWLIGHALDYPVGVQRKRPGVRERYLLRRPEDLVQDPQRWARLDCNLSSLPAARPKEEQGWTARHPERGRGAGRRNGDVAGGGKEGIGHPFGHQELLHTGKHLGRLHPGRYEASPGDAQGHPDGRFVWAVPAHVTDDREPEVEQDTIDALSGPLHGTTQVLGHFHMKAKLRPPGARSSAVRPRSRPPPKGQWSARPVGSARRERLTLRDRWAVSPVNVRFGQQLSAA